MKKSRKIVGGLLVPLVLLAVLPVSASAYPRPGATERVSVASDGAQTTGPSSSPAVSADGRYVAFASSAPNLAPDGGILLRDRQTGTTERVGPGLGGALSPSISADGRYVAFESFHDVLHPDPPGNFSKLRNVFVYDHDTATTEQVSVGPNGALPNNFSNRPAISADGRFVAFASTASNLVADDTNGLIDVFVHDRTTGVTERVSVATSGNEGNGNSGRGWSSITISADGRYVAFDSDASNLVSQDLNVSTDVFLHDRDSGTTERVSVGGDGAEGNGGSQRPAVSADGRYVAFDSWADNFVLADGDKCPYLPVGPLAGGTSCGESDVFVHDRQTGSTERVSIASDGSSSRRAPFPSTGNSWAPAISGDGRHVAFYSSATNLVPGDTNGTGDVFVHDRESGSTDRVSVGSDGAEGDLRSDGVFGSTNSPAISADGRYVGFRSAATTLVASDTNGEDDVFVRDRGLLVGVNDLAAVPVGGGISASGWATFSGEMVSSVDDPPGDGGAGAGPAGADLTGASLTYRPEQEDLLVRLRFTSLPSLLLSLNGRRVNGGVGAPGVIYRLAFDLEDVRYEVRVLRNDPATADGAPPDPLFAPPDPYFALFRCDPECSEAALLSGAIGTTGTEVRVSVPVQALGAEPRIELSAIEATTALGAESGAPLVPLDESALPDTIVSSARVELGIADASAPADEVAFTEEADLLAGDFSATIPTAGLSPGSYRVWARACLGDTCGPGAAVPVTVGELVDQKDTLLELTVEGRGQDMILRARLTVLDAPSEGIEGRTIDFYSDGELIGSAQTDDDDGVAAVAVPPGHRGANRTYKAVFAGDDLYRASSDERPGQGAGREIAF